VDEPEKEPRLILGFWEMGIIGTLMVVFFPWSLLFCFFMYGLDFTKTLVIVLVHDAIKTVFAILAVVVPIAVLIVVLFIVFIVPGAHLIVLFTSRIGGGKHRLALPGLSSIRLNKKDGPSRLRRRGRTCRA